VDVRIVAATNRELIEDVDEGRFREDLYARLAGIVVELPPLRERREDLGLLIGALLPKLAPDQFEAVRFERDAARALFCHDWPRNIRELEHALRTAAVVTDEHAAICLAQLPPALSAPRTAHRADVSPADRDAELRAQLVSLLTEHGGNVAAVARAFARTPKQIRRWAARFDIDLRAFR
jgi:transcriptional regulator with GAF, ATPase, and Fis domain